MSSDHLRPCASGRETEQSRGTTALRPPDRARSPSSASARCRDLIARAEYPVSRSRQRCLDRIELVNPFYNAVVSLRDRDMVVAEARRRMSC